MIPLIPSSNTFEVNKFFSIIREWHNCRNVYDYDILFNSGLSTNKKYPVFDFAESADKINDNFSKIKFFVNLQEGSQKIPSWISSIDDLDSSVFYVIITADKFNSKQLELKNRFNEVITYSALWFPYFLYWLTPTDLFSPLYNFPNINNNKFYDFEKVKETDFLALLGNVRPERLYVSKQLRKYFKDRCAVSLHGKIHGSTEVFKKDLPFDRTGESYSSIVPVTHNLDIFKAGEIRHTISHSVPLDLFNSAHLQIVVETQAGIDSHDNFFLTEKTTKVLFTGMPFIILGSKNYLKNLQELGFMTYDTLWNEDYDSLPTWKQRADAIIDLLKDLQHLKWKTFRKELQEIHYNNLMVLANRNKILHQNLLNLEQQLQEVINRVENP